MGKTELWIRVTILLLSSLDPILWTDMTNWQLSVVFHYNVQRNLKKIAFHLNDEGSS